MNSEQTDYNKRYYDTQKDDLRVKRAERYHSDEKYRKKVLKRAKEYYRENRDEIRARSRRSPMVVWPDGKEEEAYQISAFCMAVGKAPLTVRLWIREGKIPDTPLRRNRIRYYTQAMISLAAASIPDTFRKDWEAVHAEIERAWETVGAYDEGVEVVSK